jgi:nucleotide-binding universal stress UspA family protein
MFPYKRILCPTDFSHASYKAVEEGGTIARSLSAELHVVHVIAPLPPAGIYSDVAPADFDLVGYEESLREGVNKKLAGLVDERLSDTNTRPAVVYGDPGEEIVGYAEQSDIDLIVIATHGMKGWQHALFGSVAQKVIRKTDRNVLLVHAGTDEK